MKHTVSQELYSYWDSRRGYRSAPERSDIEPGAIRQILSDSFILAAGNNGDGCPFRLAGTRVCALFGRELKGQSFIGLWDSASRRTVTDLVTFLVDESVGTVAGVTAKNSDGDEVELELLLLPLGGRRPTFARAIGTLVPLNPLARLGLSPIGELTLGSRRHLGAATASRFMPRFIAGRARRGLIVYDGGRA
jgi:hypothetical protein